MLMETLIIALSMSLLASIVVVAACIASGRAEQIRAQPVIAHRRRTPLQYRYVL